MKLATGVEQDADEVGTIRFNGQSQRSPALVVSDIHLGPAIEQQERLPPMFQDPTALDGEV